MAFVASGASFAVIIREGAKADDPVRRGVSVQFRRHGLLDARFRGHDNSYAFIR
jgi:hypothetical protein